MSSVSASRPSDFRTPENYDALSMGHSLTNVGKEERLLSAAAGLGMILYGLSGRRSIAVLPTLIGAGLMYRGMTGHCSGYQALGLSTAEPQSPRASLAAGQGVKIESVFTIRREPKDLYDFWRDFSNLARFMEHLDSVNVVDEKHSHWVAVGPGGVRVEWDAEIVSAQSNEMLAWRSIEPSALACAGSVHFKPVPGNRGTEVRVVMRYDAPLGVAGTFLANLFGQSPEQLIEADLRRFKQLMETGEVAGTRGQPRGQCGSCRS